MIISIVHLQVKAPALDSFIAATTDNAVNSQQEAGVLRFDFLQDTKDETRFVLYEVYESEAAQKAHRDSPHFKAWIGVVRDMLAGNTTMQAMQPISPTAEEWLEDQ